MTIKAFLSLIATCLTIIAFIPYIFSIYKRTTKPHVFSWVIWGTTTIIIFFAQLSDGAGIGAWPIGLSGTITLCIAILAYLRMGDISITTFDWIFFIAGLASIPIWYITQDPLWSVIILTTIDIIGFGPTIRKCFHDPYSENLITYSIMFFRNLLVIAALEHYSATTILFPAAISASLLVVIPLILSRRLQLKN